MRRHVGKFILSSLLIIVVGIAVYGVIQSTRSYRDDLAARGIPIRYIQQEGIMALAPRAADEIATAYFEESLIHRGVPLDFITQSEVPLYDASAAEQVAVSYFSEVLVNRGLPLDYVNQLTEPPTDTTSCDQVAIAYFILNLLERGVPAEIVNQSGVPVIDSTTADQVAQAYFTQVLIDRGVPADFAHQVETPLVDLQTTDQVAESFFTHYLITDRQIPADYIASLGVRPTRIEIALEIEQIYTSYIELDQEWAGTIDHWERLVNTAIRQEEEDRLILLEGMVARGLADEVVTLEEALRQQMEAELERLEELIEEEREEMMTCVGVSFIPVLGDFIDIVSTIFTGKDPCTGEPLEFWEVVLNLTAVGEFAHVDEVVDLVRGADRVDDVLDASRSVNRLEQVEALRDIARELGRADHLEDLLQAARGLERTRELDRFLETVEALRDVDHLSDHVVITRLDDVLEAMRELERTGQLDELIVASSRLGRTNIDTLTQAMRALDNAEDAESLPEVVRLLGQSDSYDEILNYAQDIEEISEVDVVDNVTEMVYDSPRARELTVMDRFLRASRVTESIEDGAGFLRRIGLGPFIQRLGWDEYVEFVRDMPPGARQAAWEIWVEEGVEVWREMSPIRRSFGRGIGYYVEQERTIWELVYYDEQVSARVSEQVSQSLDNYGSFIEEGGNLHYLFSSQPEPSLVNQIEIVGGRVFWAPDNLP